MGELSRPSGAMFPAKTLAAGISHPSVLLPLKMLRRVIRPAPLVPSSTLFPSATLPASVGTADVDFAAAARPLAMFDAASCLPPAVVHPSALLSAAMFPAGSAPPASAG